MDAIDPKFVATERLLVDEFGLTDVVVRRLDDGIEPNPIWVAQGLWEVPAVVRFGAHLYWGVGETETESMLALADTILGFRLCPYCSQRSWLCSTEPQPTDMSPEEVAEIVAEAAKEQLGKPIELECTYQWDSAKERFSLYCAEGSA